VTQQICVQIHTTTHTLLHNRDEEEGATAASQEAFDFDVEQTLVARLFTNIANDDTDALYKLYATARKHFGQGGTRRIAYTLPPLIFGSMSLARRINDRVAAARDRALIKVGVIIIVFCFYAYVVIHYLPVLKPFFLFYF
jgi:hypothetical protein